MSSNTDPSTSAMSNAALYSERPARINKEDFFMVLALWMEHFPLSPDLVEDNKHHSRHQKVGAVLVSPNDTLYAVDCTRDDGHGVARLLMNHPDIAKGCKVFVSRKPCSLCTKLLVQSKVDRVFFPPFEPEYYDGSRRCTRTSIGKKFKQEKSQVDTLFQTSNIAQSVFLPTVAKAVFESEERKHVTNKEMARKIELQKKKLFAKFWREGWMKTVKDNLSWPGFDKNMAIKFKQDFENTMKWMAQILVKSGLDGEETLSFQRVDGNGKLKTMSNPPDNNEQLQFAHLVRMAQFLAERTDDPRTGVGAIIANKDMEIKALGWNGFPLKALYGEFPRASDTDDKVEDKKYPYIIHAEQNALLMRNDKNLKDTTLFVTKTPCDECVPYLQMQGITTIVLDAKLQKEKSKDLSYSKFGAKVDKEVFICFQRQTGIPLTIFFKNEIINCPGGCLYGGGPVL